MVCSTREDVDGILDYAHGLGESLALLHPVTVDLVVRRSGGWSSRRLGAGGGAERPAPSLAAALYGSDAVLLHYNPFSWGRWGFAPWLAPALACLRLRRPELALGVFFHERYLDMTDARSTAMGSWQRLQFHAILRCATAAFASIDTWTTTLRRQTRARVAQLPICSNVPDARGARDAARAELGLDDSTLAVAIFGMSHPARLTDHIERAVRAIAAAEPRVALLNLGANPPPFARLKAVLPVIAPGRLDAEALARHLSAADLYLAPFIDGVSSRRTTLMAALQHGIAVVGTDGPLTDPGLRAAHEALTLTAVADPDAFARAALGLAADPAGRAQQGDAGRRLYERSHDWPVACRVVLHVLGIGTSR